MTAPTQEVLGILPPIKATLPDMAKVLLQKNDDLF
jgi:hypothetical protein